MNMMSNDMYMIETTPEELALRRKVLFRLLRDTDFARPNGPNGKADESHPPVARPQTGMVVA